jgi:hypothetical protein
MSVRINPDDFYVDGVVLPQGYWRTLDTVQSQGLNGDVGSTHAPSGVIYVAGAGMWICGPSTYGGVGNFGIVTPHGSGARITHGDNDWIQFQTGAANANRNITTSLGRARDASFYPPLAAGAAPTMARFRYMATFDGIINADAGASDPAGAVVANDYPPYVQGGRIICPIRVHDQATLLQVNIGINIITHAALPANQPMFRVVSVDASGNMTPLQSNPATPGWQGNGWVQLQAGNVTAYNAWNLVVYSCDPGVICDLAGHNYFVQITDEADVPGWNALPGNVYLYATAIMTNIPDLRPG